MSKFSEWIKKEGVEIKEHLLSPFFSWVKSVIVPAAEQFLADNLPLIEKVVLSIAATEFSALTGQQKQAKANEQIKAELAGSVPNIQSSNSLINLGIELAVQNMKNGGSL
jgi:hypothetical protein